MKVGTTDKCHMEAHIQEITGLVFFISATWKFILNIGIKTVDMVILMFMCCYYGEVAKDYKFLHCDIGVNTHFRKKQRSGLT